jgi:hypothetical protein
MEIGITDTVILHVYDKPDNETSAGSTFCILVRGRFQGESAGRNSNRFQKTSKGRVCRRDLGAKLEEEEEYKEKEETGSESSDDEEGSASTTVTSSEASRFIDRRERLAALESELSIDLQTEKILKTRIVEQKQIDAKKMKELTTARNDYPSEIYEKVTSHFISLHAHGLIFVVWGTGA